MTFFVLVVLSLPMDGAGHIASMCPKWNIIVLEPLQRIDLSNVDQQCNTSGQQKTEQEASIQQAIRQSEA